MCIKIKQPETPNIIAHALTHSPKGAALQRCFYFFVVFRISSITLCTNLIPGNYNKLWNGIWPAYKVRKGLFRITCTVLFATLTQSKRFSFDKIAALLFPLPARLTHPNSTHQQHIHRLTTNSAGKGRRATATWGLVWQIKKHWCKTVSYNTSTRVMAIP